MTLALRLHCPTKCPLPSSSSLAPHTQRGLWKLFIYRRASVPPIATLSLDTQPPISTHRKPWHPNSSSGLSLGLRTCTNIGFDKSGVILTPAWLRSGFGRELVLQALQRGDKVIATARGRSVSKITDLKEKGADTYELDVNAPLDDLHVFAKKIVQAHGRVDVVVNNAGTSASGRKMQLCVDSLTGSQRLYSSRPARDCNVSTFLLLWVKGRSSEVSQA